MNLNWGIFQTGDWMIGLVSTLAAYAYLPSCSVFYTAIIF